ncbi:Spermidine synthase [Acropora cervicornis]|uniref:Spermidine synthase n=1 Tax=Acropora cervicornis TaxID=6130 RepID=A0AAD9QA14_ACRCE|nr:Spermidine synthase [Acropora cervicornis]
MACGFSSSKLTQFIGDGFEHMKEHVNEFDVIITDSSDPVGPAEPLFQQEYYELMKKALKPDGLLCCQGDCLWLDLSLIKSMVDFSKDLFPVVNYGFTTIPTYPCGQIGFIMCSKNKDTRFEDPVTVFTESEVEQMGLKYYNAEVHKSAFVLPQFAKKVIKSLCRQNCFLDHGEKIAGMWPLQRIILTIRRGLFPGKE